MIDLHNHLLPGVDDGAREIDEALRGAAALHAQGVRGLVCTPHLRGSQVAAAVRPGGYLDRCGEAWELLRAAAAEALPGVGLHRGVELMLDTPACDLSDPRLRLAGTRFVLVEFPFLTVPPRVVHALDEVRRAGWVPVVAHPERYGNARADLTDAAAWKDAGACLQVNAGSLVGRYGSRAGQLAWGLVHAGLADILASDHHARGTPHLAAALAALERAGGTAQARLLATDNPARILDGDAPLPVPALPERAPLLRRIAAALRRPRG